MESKKCSKCKQNKESILKRYCKICSAKYIKEWRLKVGIIKKHHTGLCKCGEKRAIYNHSYCRKCANEKARFNRKKYENLAAEEKFKCNVRARTKMRIKRGSLIKLPCEICDDKNVEAHHPDYNKPDKVIFLCKKHHLMIHGR